IAVAATDDVEQLDLGGEPSHCCLVLGCRIADRLTYFELARALAQRGDDGLIFWFDKGGLGDHAKAVAEGQGARFFRCLHYISRAFEVVEDAANFRVLSHAGKHHGVADRLQLNRATLRVMDVGTSRVNHAQAPRAQFRISLWPDSVDTNHDS